MIRRRDSLEATLHEIEDGGLEGVSVIVVNRAWWDELPGADRRTLQTRSASLGVALRADDRLSRHFVELGSGPVAPRLSSEREV